jgi:hypothetical protein
VSNRTLVELNHDHCPREAEAPAWAAAMREYMRSGDKECLPYGVTWKDMRHHSDPEPTRDSLLERAIADALAPLITTSKGPGGVLLVGRATRKKAEKLAHEAVKVLRKNEA